MPRKPISYLYIRFPPVLFGLILVLLGLVVVGLRPAVGARVVNRAPEWLVRRDASRVRDGPLRRWDDYQRAMPAQGDVPGDSNIGSGRQVPGILQNLVTQRDAVRTNRFVNALANKGSRQASTVATNQRLTVGLTVCAQSESSRASQSPFHPV